MSNFQSVSTFNAHYVKLAVIVEAMLASRNRKLEEVLINTWYLKRFPRQRMPTITNVTAFAAVVARAQESLHAHS